MNKLKITLLMSLLLNSATMFSQSTEEAAIKSTITSFAKAGDQNNASELAKYLDGNYRIVMNQMFGSKEVTVMPREVYLQKIESKEFGGDNRKVGIENIIINGNTASATVTFAGTKMTFISLLILVQETTGKWKLVCETPVIKS